MSEQMANFKELKVMEFEPGELAPLKSGGPLMTVKQVGEAYMTGEPTGWCAWFEKVSNGEVKQEATFRPAVLEKSARPTAMSVGVVRR